MVRDGSAARVPRWRGEASEAALRALSSHFRTASTMANPALPWIMCPACGSGWDIDRERVPAAGLRLRCPACGERFAFGAADLRPPPNPDVELLDARDKAGAEENWELADQLAKQIDANRRARIAPKADVSGEK